MPTQPPNMMTEYTDPSTSGPRTPTLISLPKELLSQIFSWLTTPDLRVLGCVNHQLHDLVTDYP